MLCHVQKTWFYSILHNPWLSQSLCIFLCDIPSALEGNVDKRCSIWRLSTQHILIFNARQIIRCFGSCGSFIAILVFLHFGTVTLKFGLNPLLYWWHPYWHGWQSVYNVFGLSGSKLSIKLLFCDLLLAPEANEESPCCDGFPERKISNNGKALRTSSIS